MLIFEYFIVTVENKYHCLFVKFLNYVLSLKTPSTNPLNVFL